MSATQTPSLSISVTPSISISMTPSLSISRTRTPSITPSETPSISISISPSLTPSITPTKTPSPSEGAVYSNVVAKYTVPRIIFRLHGDEEWGPTAITEYWNGINPPASGYTIYTLTASRHEPSIVVAHNNDECIWFARSFGGTNINTIDEAINYLLSGSTETTIVNSNSLENIVTDGLYLYVDPGILPSYPRTGTHATDLAYATGWDFGGSTVSFDPITQSFNFDDSSTAKYIVTDTYFTILSPTTGMTYDFWCYLSGGGSSGLPSLFFDRGQSSIPFVWIYENSGYMAIQCSYGAGYTAINFTTTVRNVWRHIVITFQYGSSSDTEIKSYINSNIDLSHKPNITSLFPSEYTDKYIGCYGISNGHNWNGKIGPVKIYNRVLSQAEVLQNYNATKNRYGL